MKNTSFSWVFFGGGGVVGWNLNVPVFKGLYINFCLNVLKVITKIDATVNTKRFMFEVDFFSFPANK